MLHPKYIIFEKGEILLSKGISKFVRGGSKR